MTPSTHETSQDPPSSTPYDLTTLQERIQREIIGISALSDFLATFEMQSTGSQSTEDRTDEGKLEESHSAKPKVDMIRVRLDDEFWVDMTPEQVTGFLSRKEASLRAVEERRENLEQLQEWMIHELRDMGSHASRSTSIEESNNMQQQRESDIRKGPPATIQTERAVSSESAKTVEPATTQQPPSITATAPTNLSTDLTPHHPVSQTAVPKEAIKQLEDINAALSKFGTSMEEVLKLDPQTASDGAGTPLNGTEIGQDGTVLNEEGLPFHDIRENLPSSSDPSQTEDIQSTGEAIPVEPLPVDDYWSEEAVERRRKLRESLFGNDDDDEEDEEEDSDADEKITPQARVEEIEETAPHAPVPNKSTAAIIESKPIPLPEPEIATPPMKANGKGKAPARKAGFMARSTVIDHSTEKDAPEDVDVVPTPTVKTITTASTVNNVSPAKLPTAVPVPLAPLAEVTERETAGTAERRKSVTFNPQTRVRLYEKGEVMPIASVPAVKAEPASRFEVLPDEEDSAKKSPATASTAAAKPAPAKARDTGVFAGFKKGFLDGANPVKQAKAPTAVPAKPSKPSSPSPAISIPTAAVPEPTTAEAPEYHQPLAPAHEKPVRAKRQSVFSQRKAVAQSKRDQLMNFSSFDPMTAAEPVGTGAPVGTGSKASNPMKMAVVEKATAVAMPPVQPKPASGPIPTAPSAQQFPPNAKKQTAVKEAVMERKPAAPTPIPSSEPTPADDSDSDSPADFDYSDGEDAFDMDEALLAREAALAYHAKRSQLGRAGLGGWTGNIGPDGEVEWDTEIVPMSAGMEAAPPRTGAVAFGEKIIPVGMEGMRLPTSGTIEGQGDSSEDEADDTGVASISFPQVIPASEDLASSIKIGKLENGNLVVQDADDSDDDDEDDAATDAASLTPDQKAIRDQAAEEKRQRKAMIERLRRGDVSEMIREEREREAEYLRNGGGYVEPPKEGPPELGSEPGTGAGPVRGSGKKTAGARNVVPSSGIVPSTATVSDPAPPKKVSRFKAARMASS